MSSVPAVDATIQKRPPWEGYAFVFGFIILAFLPAWFVLFSNQAKLDHLSHFPLTILLVLYLAYRDYQSLPPMKLRWSIYGGLWVFVSIALVALACLLKSGWLGSLACVSAVWAACVFAGDRDTRSLLRPAVLMSLMLFQPPFGLDQMVIIAMQKWSSWIASLWLDQLSIANLLTGVVIRTPGNDYLVEEACSGVNSLFAALVVAVFWVLFQRYRLLRGAVVVACALFWVIAANAVRVFSIVYFDIRYGIDLIKEPNHTLLGLAVFVGVILATASSDGLFQFLLPPALRRDPDKYKEREGDATEIGIRWRKFGIASLVVILLVTSVGMFRPSGKQVAQGVINDTTLVPYLVKNTLPEQIGVWKLIKHERLQRESSDAFGMVSELYRYTNGSTQVAISLDGPYEGWHDLGYCYGALDWQIRDSGNLELTTASGLPPITCVEMNMYREKDEYALVLFTSVDSTGAVIRPPASHGSILRSFTNRLGMTTLGETMSGKPVRSPVFQVQFNAQSTREFDADTRASLDALYDITRRRLISQIGGGSAE